MKVKIIVILLFSFYWVSAQNGKLAGDWSHIMTVENQAKINTEFTDFAPSYWNDYIVFTSSKTRQKIFDPNIKEGFFDLYLSAVGKSNNLERSAQLSKILNTKYHDASSSFTSDGNTIYFSRMNDDGYMNIYKSHYQDGEWEEAIPMVINESESQSVHPTVSVDSKIIIFASNRAGGYGLMDLYFTIYQDGEWSEPMNLGPVINSEDNEVFPYLSHNNFLFYSSDGGENSDLDIYKTMFKNGKNHKIVRLPYPINTEYDDLSIISDFEGLNGFLSSNRPGGAGKDDIYKFNSSQSIFGYGETDYNIMTLTAKDGESKKILTNVIIRYRHLKEEEIISFNKSLFNITQTSYDSVLVDKNGKAQIKLLPGYTVIEAESPQKEKWQIALTDRMENKSIDILMNRLKPELIDTSQKTKVIIKPTLKNTELAIGTILVFDNIYYDYNSHEIQSGAAQELDELSEAMLKNANLKVQLASHTDSRGEDKYNLLLSERRAISAKAYLISKGIQPNRIFTIGYGESQLRNHCKDGVKCSDKEHLFNRRTEVKILDN
ncbi:MAG: OmpA family protein [Saprospiraceae bacterium]|nr:OmpA family protein [Bacteroidia bacterium]NNL93904.1 OmpA family protein [Saprospiraceae bacterium]